MMRDNGVSELLFTSDNKHGLELGSTEGGECKFFNDIGMLYFAVYLAMLFPWLVINFLN